MHLERAEAELAEVEQALREANQPPQTEPDNEPAATPEEDIWKNRYGNLRRHSQEKETRYQERITTLERQVEDSVRQAIKFPQTEQQLDEWVQTYPDVAGFVHMISTRVADQHTTDIKREMEDIKREKARNTREKALIALMQLHPDFEDIRADPKYRDWLQRQPDWVQAALIANETDAASAGRALDLYKADMAKLAPAKPDTRRSDVSAAEDVGTRSRPETPRTDGGAGKKLYESEVERWSSAEYERRMPEIEAAINSGNFEYDIRYKNFPTNRR